ncbi:hypothetical protein CQA53_06905 [Helicobacter didelphidarum]|uniref:Uncharacterized protein n=1 Tax=Helicobacter didelphidarum TaxID=2040648 RepID=A0A3D8IK47_9HELI|nr:hypothetical protein [Helicobacter didelphidarum]RDU65295.1 hypothetical protein CQA53_06905 [Helicobacter didelphidarum]
MNKYKKFSLGILIPLPFFFVLVTLLYLYDPMQFWHKPYWREITFSGDARIQNKGIIDHYDFDSIILGTSMLEKTSTQEANDKLGGIWANLSMSGGTFNQRAIILQYALQKKHIKHVVYSFDPDYFTYFWDTSGFAFLYKNSNLDIIKFYFNWRFVSCALRWSKDKKCVGEKRIQQDSTINTQEIKSYDISWIKPELTKIAEKNMNSFLEENATKHKPNRVNTSIIDKYVLSFVKNNPNTQFSFIIPTYSRFAYYANGIEFFRQTKQYIIYFLQQIETLPNATLYGFDDLDYADDITHYWERTHYNADMNSIQLDSIAKGKHILTQDNIESYFETMEKKIREYDITSLVRIIHQKTNSHEE